MKRGILLAIVLISLVLLTACSRVPAGETPQESAAAFKQAQSGTEGIEIKLTPNFPPSTVYDETELIALVEVHNKGNFDLDQQACFIQITGFDPNIISGDFAITRSCAENFGTLEGKNVYNLQGSQNLLEFRSSNIILPDGVFEYNPTLHFTACYNYQTRASPQVCVDPLFYQVSSEQKTCTPSDVSLGGGQGGPVSVTWVGVDMIGNKGVFEINIANRGDGTVLSPYSDIRSCGQASLTHTDLNRVGYTVQMSGASAIDCKPHDGFVRLTNEQGKIVCTAQVPGTTAFTTPLQIALDYSYLESQERSVKIIATPQIS